MQRWLISWLISCNNLYTTYTDIHTHTTELVHGNGHLTNLVNIISGVGPLCVANVCITMYARIRMQIHRMDTVGVQEFMHN